ncbi:MAG: hypothetical protein E3J72_10030 [Planctomycetota bacterium]|nr:MAG: hypothetical protein E3J72_10030 [Planctomycetota bacterium]
MKTNLYITSFGFIDSSGFGGTGSKGTVCGLPERFRWREFSERPYERFGRLDILSKHVLVACESADLPLAEDGGKNHGTGIVLGTQSGSLSVDADYYRSTAEISCGSPALFSYTLPNISIGEIAARYGIAGPNSCIMAGSSSGTAALREGIRIIEGGEAESCIVVAADAASTENAELFGLGRAGHAGASCFAYAFVLETSERADTAHRKPRAVVSWTGPAAVGELDSLSGPGDICRMLMDGEKEKPDSIMLPLATSRSGRGDVIVIESLPERKAGS